MFILWFLSKVPFCTIHTIFFETTIKERKLHTILARYFLIYINAHLKSCSISYKHAVLVCFNENIVHCVAGFSNGSDLNIDNCLDFDINYVIFLRLSDLSYFKLSEYFVFTQLRQ